jgi:N-acetylglucosamine repressor
VNKQIGNVQLMQTINRVKVLHYFRQHPFSSRPQAAADIGLSPASLTNITSYLIDKNLLKEVGTEKVARVGRKSTLLCFNEEARNLLFVGISRDTTNVFRVNLDGEPKEVKSLSMIGLKIDEVVSLICDKIQEYLDLYGESSFMGIGLFLSGLVLTGNRFIFSADLNWDEYDFVSKIEKITSLPVIIENTTVLNAMAFFKGTAYTSEENVIFLDMQDGIGMTYFSKGRVNTDILGEVGHTTVDMNGPECNCGNRGCLEIMCSVDHALSLYQEASHKAVTIQELNELLAQRDPAAMEAVNKCAEYLGVALTNIMKLFMPSILVCNMGDYMKCRSIWEGAIHILQANMQKVFGRTLPVQEVTLKEKDVLAGMAIRICDKLFDVDYFQNI